MQVAIAVGVLLIVATGAIAQEGSIGSEDDYVKDVISDALYFVNACGPKDLLVCLKVRNKIALTSLSPWRKLERMVPLTVKENEY